MGSDMRIDFQIAILLAIAAIPTGAALMAVPIKFQRMSRFMVDICFYGGIALTLVLIGSAILIAMHGEGSEMIASKNDRILPLIGMIFFGVGFLACLAWRFWPHPTPNNTPWKHTLEDLYKQDFPYLKLGRVLQTGLINPNNTEEHTEISINISVMQDFQSQVDFISFYIPTQNLVWADTLMYSLIHKMRDDIRPLRDQIVSDVATGTRSPGSQYISSKDLSFSGKVYFYTMTSFNIIQLGELANWYKEKNLSLEIRGYDYWWAQKDR